LKKYTIILLFVARTIFGQNVSVYTEVQNTQPKKDFVVQGIPQNYYAWQWLGYTGKNGKGIYVQTSQDPSTKTFSLGYIYSKDVTKNRTIELGIGPGIEYNRSTASRPLSLSGYASYETKTEDERARGKFVGITNIYYSKNFGIWTQSWAMYSVQTWFAIGIHIQTDAAIGPRIQISTPHGFSLWGVYDLEKKQSGSVCTIGIVWQRSFKISSR
jgi:hypothetical protein